MSEEEMYKLIWPNILQSMQFALFASSKEVKQITANLEFVLIH